MEKTNTTKATASIILMGILVLAAMGLATAKTIYSGETIYEDLQGEIQNLQSLECNLTAENYNLNGTNFTTNETGYILEIDLNFKPDNLTISCLLNGEKFVKKETYGGGFTMNVGKEPLEEVNESIDEPLNETLTSEDTIKETTKNKSRGFLIATIIIFILIVYLFFRSNTSQKEVNE